MGRYDSRSIDRIARASEDITDLAGARQALLDALVTEFSWTGGVWWSPDAAGGLRCLTTSGSTASATVGDGLEADAPPLEEAAHLEELVLLEEGVALPPRLHALGATSAAVVPMGEGHLVELILTQSRHLGAASRGILVAAGEAAARAYRNAQRLADVEARLAAALAALHTATEAAAEAAAEATAEATAEAAAVAEDDGGKVARTDDGALQAAEARAEQAEAALAAALAALQAATEATPAPVAPPPEVAEVGADDDGWDAWGDGEDGSVSSTPTGAPVGDLSSVWVRLLTDLGVSLSTSWDVPSTLSQALMALAEVLGWRWGAAWTWQVREGALRSELFYGEEPGLESATLAVGLSEDVDSADPVVAAWSDGAPRWSPVDGCGARDQAAEEVGLGVRVCVPVMVGEDRVGVLESYAPALPDAAMVGVLRVFQQMVSDRLQQLRLERRSTDLSMLPTMAGMIIDALSGLEAVEDVWTTIAAALNDLIWADARGVMYLEKGEEGGDRLRAAMPEDHVDEIAPAILEADALSGLPGRCLREGALITLHNVLPECAWGRAIQGADFSTVVCVPVPCSQIAPAVLLLLWREAREPDAYWQNAMLEAGRIVAQVSDQVAARGLERQGAQDVQRIMGLLDRIAVGDIEGRLEGPMVAGLVGMRDNVHRIAQTVDEFQEAIKELTRACASGDLQRRTDATRFEGAWASVVVGVNQMMDVMERPIGVVAERLDRLSSGREAQKIEDRFQGDFGRLAEATNNLIHIDARIQEMTERIAQGDLSVRLPPRTADDRLLLSLGRMVDILEQFQRAIAGLIQACASGDLSASADKSGFQGAFLDMVGGMNEAIAAVAGPTQEAVEVLSRLAVGAQPPPLKGRYTGDFARLAVAINGLLTTNNEIADLAERIARGDLTVQVEVRSGEDRLLSSLGRMVGELNDALMSLDQRALEVSGGSEQVETSSRALSENAVQAAASASQMKEATDGLRVRTRENVERAERARACTRAAATASEAGATQMNQMLSVMRQIEEESSRIGNIVRVIDEIAFQTNLLALNAAVEAARAGNHGKGFAVVAEEVRNLAARSATAAKEIGQVIHSSMQRTEKGVVAAEASATSLNGILGSTREASELVHDIAEASDKQRESIDALHSGINRLDQVIQSNSAQSEEMAAAAVEMNAQVRAMKDLLARFDLRPAAPALPPALAALPPELLQRLLQAMQQPSATHTPPPRTRAWT